MKKLLAISALGMLVAACNVNAAGIIANSQKELHAEITFAKTVDMTTRILPAANLYGGKDQPTQPIGFIEVSHNDLYDTLVWGDEKAADYDNATMRWTISGKNNPHNNLKVVVAAQGINANEIRIDGKKYFQFTKSGQAMIATSVMQDIEPDVYPVTVNVAAYQP